MNPHIEAIATELQSGAYAGLEHWQIAERLNAVDPELPKKRVNVHIATARGLLLARGAWPAICLTADNHDAPIPLRGACIMVRDSLTPPMELLHTSDPPTLAAIEACLDGLVAGTVITQQLRDELLALSLQPQSWVEMHGLDAVTARDVALAQGEE